MTQDIVTRPINLHAIVDRTLILREPLSTIESTMLKRFEVIGLFAHKIGPHTDAISYLASRFAGYIKLSAKVYLPIHMMIQLMRLRKQKNIKPLEEIRRLFISVLRSSLFVACFGMSIPMARVAKPMIRLFDNNIASWSGFIVSFVFSWAIFCEAPARWPEVSLYVLAQWLEGYTYSLVKRGYVPHIANFDKVVFALAVAILAQLHYSLKDETLQSGKEMKKNKISQAIELIIGGTDSSEQPSVAAATKKIE